MDICDNDADGDDTNGFIQNINLASQSTTILNGSQNPADFTVTYHESAADATAGDKCFELLPIQIQ